MGLPGRILLSLAAFAPSLVQAQPAVLATAADLTLRERFWGVGIESACGTEWLLLNYAHQLCVKRGSGGRLDVTAVADSPLGPLAVNVVREPVAGDRRLILGDANGGFFPTLAYGYDPLLGSVTNVGNLPAGAGFQPLLLADYEGDGVAEVVIPGGIAGGAGAMLVALPGSPQPLFHVVRQVPFLPTAAGRFDVDAQSELAVVNSNNLLQFYDPVTLLQEPFLADSYFSRDGIAFTGDWDGDGIDELALPEYFDTGIGLVDPNAGSQVIAVARALWQPKRALGLVDWSGPNARDLVVHAANGVQIVNPRNGATLASFAFAEQLGEANPEHARAIDWDQDGDQDFVWVGADSYTLNLLRNPQGLEMLQRGAREKQPLGEILVNGERRVLTLETFGNQQILRTRHPDTLALVSEVALQSQLGFSPAVLLADVDSNAGTEVLSIEPGRLRLHATSTGALLWEIQPPAGRQHGFNVAATDSPSAGQTAAG